MASFLPPLLRGVALGLGAAAPIGPINVQIARRSLRFGFFGGFALGCGAVTADLLYVLLSALSVVTLAPHRAVSAALGVCGGCLLVYLGVGCFRAAARHRLGSHLFEPEAPARGRAADRRPRVTSPAC